MLNGRALDIRKIFSITERNRRHRGTQRLKKQPNFFARAKKLESSFLLSQKMKNLKLCDLCVNLKKSF
jgi:hypothetical protein